MPMDWTANEDRYMAEYRGETEDDHCQIHGPDIAATPGCALCAECAAMEDQ